MGEGSHMIGVNSILREEGREKKERASESYSKVKSEED
jgi:hypothetical protein